MAKRRVGRKRSKNLKTIAEHQDREIPFFMHQGSDKLFIDFFVIELSLLAGAIDASEIPAGFEAGKDDAGGCVAVLKEVT